MHACILAATAAAAASAAAAFRAIPATITCRQPRVSAVSCQEHAGTPPTTASSTHASTPAPATIQYHHNHQQRMAGASVNVAVILRNSRVSNTAQCSRWFDYARTAAAATRTAAATAVGWWWRQQLHITGFACRHSNAPKHTPAQRVLPRGRAVRGGGGGGGGEGISTTHCAGCNSGDAHANASNHTPHPKHPSPSSATAAAAAVHDTAW